MCRKTKLLTERVCLECQNEYHLLYFRFIENKLVYYYSKCTKCNYSIRKNMSIDKWKQHVLEDIELQQITKHHRIPRSKGGTNEVSNISLVPQNKHVAYHSLFGNKSPQEIADMLNKIWIDPEFLLVVIPNPKKT